MNLKFQSTPPWRERPQLHVLCDFPITDFNPRPREGSDRIYFVNAYVSSEFQSTPPWRERLLTLTIALKLANFNPRPREGSDVSIYPELTEYPYFNPRPREGSDIGDTIRVVRHDKFQSTPPWRERRHWSTEESTRSNISIHAPVKGATLWRRNATHIITNFNPRPREGSDVAIKLSTYRRFKFQSTPPWRERRSFQRVRPNLPPPISIHAPVKGATREAVGIAPQLLDFNPRPREGSDCFPEGHTVPGNKFQSTPPWRERQGCNFTRCRQVNFNPRPREGSDQFGYGKITDDVISIHAPVKGATWLGISRARWFTFQSTPPWRERPPISRSVGTGSSFQSTPPWRERPYDCIPCTRLALFQSTPPWRERRCCRRWNLFCYRFQSTPPWRERLLKSTVSTSVISWFQSTPPWRERPIECKAEDVIHWFQSTPPWRERRYLLQDSITSASDFNPRPREGSDFVGKISSNTR